MADACMLFDVPNPFSPNQGPMGAITEVPQINNVFFAPSPHIAWGEDCKT